MVNLSQWVNTFLAYQEERIYIYIYIERERERERENLPFWVHKIWIEWNREYQIFIVNDIRRRRIKIKGK